MPTHTITVVPAGADIEIKQTMTDVFNKESWSDLTANAAAPKPKKDLPPPKDPPKFHDVQDLLGRVTERANQPATLAEGIVKAPLAEAQATQPLEEQPTLPADTQALEQAQARVAVTASTQSLEERSTHAPAEQAQAPAASAKPCNEEESKLPEAAEVKPAVTPADTLPLPSTERDEEETHAPETTEDDAKQQEQQAEPEPPAEARLDEPQAQVPEATAAAAKQTQKPVKEEAEQQDATPAAEGAAMQPGGGDDDLDLSKELGYVVRDALQAKCEEATRSPRFQEFEFLYHKKHGFKPFTSVPFLQKDLREFNAFTEARAKDCLMYTAIIKEMLECEFYLSYAQWVSDYAESNVSDFTCLTLEVLTGPEGDAEAEVSSWLSFISEHARWKKKLPKDGPTKDYIQKMRDAVPDDLRDHPLLEPFGEVFQEKNNRPLFELLRFVKEDCVQFREWLLTNPKKAQRLKFW